MKFTLQQLRLGQVVEARVVEVLGSGAFIVSFSGDLIRVANHTGRPFQGGESIQLKVTGLRPLSFSYLALSRTKRVI